VSEADRRAPTVTAESGSSTRASSTTAAIRPTSATDITLVRIAVATLPGSAHAGSSSPRLLTLPAFALAISTVRPWSIAKATIPAQSRLGR
jgi:hypothetical protein